MSAEMSAADAADLEPHRLRQVFAHTGNKRRKLRALREHRTVDILHAITGLCEHTVNLAQKHDTVRPGIARVVVREKLADVPERRRAEQGVHQRVGQYVRVGMAQQSLLIGDLHPAEDQLSPLDQPVHIIPMSDSHFRPPCSR